MEDQDDPAFRRLLSNLRRRWPIPAACAVAASALLAIVGGATKYQAAARLHYLGNSGILAAVKLDPISIEKSMSPSLDVEAISMDSVKKSVSEAVHANAQATFVPSADLTSVDIIVTSTTASAAQAALDKYVELFRSHRSDQVKAIMDGVANALNVRAGTTTKRIAELDDLLKPLGTGEEVLANAYLVERTQLVSDRGVIDSQLAAVAQYEKQAAASVRTAQASPAKSDHGVVKNAIAGFVGGILIGLSVIAALTYLDRRVRTRSDVEVPAGLRLLASFAKDADSTAAAVLATAMAAEADSTASANFIVYATAAVPHLPDVMNDVRSTLIELVPNATLEVIDDPTALRQALLRARAIPQVVLVTRWGATRRSELTSTAASFARAGARVVGVALCSVPARALAQVDE